MKDVYKRQVWEVPAHEWIFSVGAIWDVGGTGSKKIGSDSANTFTPTLYFGKGMGDLPDALDALKPVAVTGTLGVDPVSYTHLDVYKRQG